MFDLWITLLATLCSMQGIDASPLVARRTRVCYDENDNIIACPQSKWSTTKIIIICTIVGVVLFLMIASYIMKNRRVQPIRPWARPLTVQTARVHPRPDSGLPFLPRTPQESRKDEVVRPHSVSRSETLLIPPPPAYTPSYKL